MGKKKNALESEDIYQLDALYQKMAGPARLVPVEHVREWVSRVYKEICGEEGTAELQGALDRAVALYGSNTTAMLRRMLFEVFVAGRQTPSTIRGHLSSLFSKELHAQKKMPSKEQVREIITKVVEEAMKHDTNVAGAILYGSWHRGEQRPDSDVDLIMIKKEADQELVRDFAQEIARKLEVSDADTFHPYISLDAPAEAYDILYSTDSIIGGDFTVISPRPDVQEAIEKLRGSA